VVAPPFTSLRSVQVVIEQDHMRIGLGAQDVHWESQGAYTGEVSAPMLAKLACRYVIVGHSERREHFGETDEIVNRKARAVLSEGMRPIVCVGETLDEREAGRAEDVVTGQVTAALNRLDDLSEVVIAYEPVWAIGTGRHAVPDDAGIIAEVIRETLRQRADSVVADGVRVLYGGRSTPATSKTSWRNATSTAPSSEERPSTRTVSPRSRGTGGEPHADPAPTRRVDLEPGEPVHRMDRCRSHREGRGRGPGGGPSHR
jgi:triosephosphate isomerase